MVTPHSSSLYQEFILRHNRAPFHFAKMEAASHIIEAYNPLCGDRFQLYFELEAGIIRDLYFHGYGCSISKASCSVLAEKIIDQPLEEAVAICEDFLQALQADEWEGDPDFAPFAQARHFPGREQCARLGWESLLAFCSSGFQPERTRP